MSYPESYNPLPLGATVVIFDLNNVEVFRFEMPQLAATPIQNFPMSGVSLDMGTGENHGVIEIFVDDRDRLFMETIEGVPRSKFKPGWTVQVFCGKTIATKSLWALGVLQDVDITYSTNLNFQKIICFGYGIRTAQRLSIMKRSQNRKIGQPLTPDPTDVKTFISQIFKDVLTDTDHLAAPGLGQLDITTENVTLIDIPIFEYDKNLVSFGSMLSELATMGNCYYGIGPDKVAYLYKKGEVSSGFLVSNDITPAPTDTSNANPLKLMFFRNQSLVSHDTSSESAYSILHVVGGQLLILDRNQTSKTSDFNTNDATLAYQFTPTVDNIAELKIRLAKNNTINSDLKIAIVGDVGGTPNLSNIRKSVLLKASYLDNVVLSEGNFIHVKFDKFPVARGEKLYLVIFQTTNTITNALVSTFQLGSGTFFESDNNGASWDGGNVGAGTFITYASKNVRIIAENGIASKSLLVKEGIINMPDTPDQDTVLKVLESMLETVTKVQRTFDPITVSTPDSLPELGKTFRLIDIVTGMDTNLDLINYKVSIDSSNPAEIRGAIDMTISFQGTFN